MTLLDALIKISDHGSELLSKMVHHVGITVGIGGGAVVNVTGKAIADTQISPITAFVLEWGGMLSMAAAGTLIIKNIVDGVVNALKAKWDRQEQIKRMNKDD